MTSAAPDLADVPVVTNGKVGKSTFAQTRSTDVHGAKNGKVKLDVPPLGVTLETKNGKSSKGKVNGNGKAAKAKQNGKCSKVATDLLRVR